MNVVIGDDWIETTTFRDHNRTQWVIRRSGAVVQSGEVRDDPSGARAYDVALAWAAVHAPGVVFNWKHAQGAASAPLDS